MIRQVSAQNDKIRANLMELLEQRKHIELKESAAIRFSIRVPVRPKGESIFTRPVDGSTSPESSHNRTDSQDFRKIRSSRARIGQARPRPKGIYLSNVDMQQIQESEKVPPEEKPDEGSIPTSQFSDTSENNIIQSHLPETPTTPSNYSITTLDTDMSQIKESLPDNIEISVLDTPVKDTNENKESTTENVVSVTEKTTEQNTQKKLDTEIPKIAKV